MTKISMDLVKELREKTQVGMLDCKKALEETNGDIEKAIELLRKKGANVALKRADNVTNHGNIGAALSQDSKIGAVVKISCETDFSANTKDLLDFTDLLAKQVLTSTSKDIESLLTEKIVSSNLSIKDKLNDIIAKIAENIKVEEFYKFEVKNHGLINYYIHPGANVGVLIELSTDKAPTDITELKTLAKDLCMQIVVTKPLSISPKDLDQNLIEKEKDIIKEQLKTSGKPENMIEKIAIGKLSKYYQDVCLLEQLFIKDDKITVKDYINQIGKKLGLKIDVNSFKRLNVGK